MQSWKHNPETRGTTNRRRNAWPFDQSAEVAAARWWRGWQNNSGKFRNLLLSCYSYSLKIMPPPPGAGKKHYCYTSFQKCALDLAWWRRRSKHIYWEGKSKQIQVILWLVKLCGKMSQWICDFFSTRKLLIWVISRINHCYWSRIFDFQSNLEVVRGSRGQWYSTFGLS